MTHTFGHLRDANSIVFCENLYSYNHGQMLEDNDVHKRLQEVGAISSDTM